MWTNVIATATPHWANKASFRFVHHNLQRCLSSNLFNNNLTFGIYTMIPEGSCLWHLLVWEIYQTWDAMTASPMLTTTERAGLWGAGSSVLKILNSQSFLVQDVSTSYTGWWFQIFFIFIPTWGNDPIWLIFFSNGLKPPTSILFIYVQFDIQTLERLRGVLLPGCQKYYMPGVVK